MAQIHVGTDTGGSFEPSSPLPPRPDPDLAVGTKGTMIARGQDSGDSSHRDSTQTKSIRPDSLSLSRDHRYLLFPLGAAFW
jgi:hypothetical protein